MLCCCTSRNWLFLGITRFLTVCSVALPCCFTSRSTTRPCGIVTQPVIVSSVVQRSTSGRVRSPDFHSCSYTQRLPSWRGNHASGSSCALATIENAHSAIAKPRIRPPPLHCHSTSFILRPLFYVRSRSEEHTSELQSRQYL